MKRFIATELIDYQNKDRFVTECENLVYRILDEVGNDPYNDTTRKVILKSENVKKLVTLIRERFNMNIVLDPELHQFTPAAVWCFFGDYLRDYQNLNKLGSGFFSDLFGFSSVQKHVNLIEKERKEIYKSLHNKKGTIDLKNARMSGYLSEVKHYLIINFHCLKNQLGLTAREITAVILHEIGHAFTGLEYHFKLEKTNATISDIMHELNGNNVEKATYIFKREFGEKEFKDLMLNETSTRYDFCGALARKQLKSISTQMVNDRYDQTNFENLADSFATRFQVGKELVTGLNKIHVLYGQVTTGGAFLYYSITLLLWIWECLFIALTGPIGIVYAGLAIFLIYNDNFNELTYDSPKDRYNRIRNGIVNNLKRSDIPDDVKKDLLEQYQFIDDIIKGTKGFKSICERISGLLLSVNRNNSEHIQIQQTIENGLNNELFVKSAQLSL